MNDLEITKLCAAAMGLTDPQPMIGEWIRTHSNIRYLLPNRVEVIYDPLHDDAQAMALVKKFRLTINVYENGWIVNETVKGMLTRNDLNRAICECVAKMQKAKCSA